MLTPQQKYFSGRLKLKPLTTTTTTTTTTTINANNISVCCSLTKANLENIPIRLIPKTVKCVNNSIRFQNYVSATEFGDENDMGMGAEFGMAVQDGCRKGGKDYIMGKMYRCLYEKQAKKLKFTLLPSPKLQFTLQSIEQPKFAKTPKLQSLLSGSPQPSGLLTMDQSGRILLESQQCPFPAIGLWLRCGNLHEATVYMNIYAFLRKRPGKMWTKLVSVLEGRSYVYFVRIWDGEMPELFIVSWGYEEPQSGQKEIDIQYNVTDDQNVVLELNQQYLEFTLRGEGASCKKDTDFVSPRKQMTNQELEEQLQKLHLQESPQFSSIKKYGGEHDWLEERTQLKQIVQVQQTQIETLKKQVERLRRELDTVKNSVKSPESKLLNCFRSPVVIQNSSTPADRGKKLSSSDLESSASKFFQSGSTKQKNSMEDGFNFNSNSQETTTKQAIQCDQEPWDIIEIIQATQ